MQKRLTRRASYRVFRISSSTITPSFVSKGRRQGGGPKKKRMHALFATGRSVRRARMDVSREAVCICMRDAWRVAASCIRGKERFIRTIRMNGQCTTRHPVGRTREGGKEAGERRKNVPSGAFVFHDRLFQEWLWCTRYQRRRRRPPGEGGREAS